MTEASLGPELAPSSQQSFVLLETRYGQVFEVSLVDLKRRSNFIAGMVDAGIDITDTSAPIPTSACLQVLRAYATLISYPVLPQPKTLEQSYYTPYRGRHVSHNPRKWIECPVCTSHRIGDLCPGAALLGELVQLCDRLESPDLETLVRWAVKKLAPADLAVRVGYYFTAGELDHAEDALQALHRKEQHPANKSKINPFELFDSSLADHFDAETLLTLLRLRMCPFPPTKRTNKRTYTIRPWKEVAEMLRLSNTGIHERNDHMLKMEQAIRQKRNDARAERKRRREVEEAIRVEATT